MKSIKTYLLIALASLAIMTSAARAETKEGQIRAALLFQFARLTTFPDSAFAASDGPMVIGLLGDAEFSDMLTKGVTGKKIGTHVVAVKSIASAAEIKGCQVVYVAPGQDAAAAIAAE